MGRMQVSFRPATEDDLERLVDIHTAAFPDPRGQDARVRNFARNAFGALSDLWILVEGGITLAHAFLFPLEAWFGGRRVAVGGVATVGVAPEARGRGLGTRLLEHLHAIALARGDALTALYPFRQAFYARLGYAPASGYRRLRLHPASIPWRCETRARPARASDLTVLAACWDAAAARRTGSLARTERVWEARLAEARRTWLVVEGAEGVEGYVAWTIDQDEPHTETRLVVNELAALSVAAERSLWGLVGAQRDQVAVVHADVATDDPVDCALVDADRARFGDASIEHAIGDVAAGPMLRLTDVRRALEARGWAADGTAVLAIDGETLELAVRGGRAAVVPSRAHPDVRVDARTLAAITFGGLRPVHAARLGWLEAHDERALARIDALLAVPPFFSPDPF
jgi:predicted acetyltransferase